MMNVFCTQLSLCNFTEGLDVPHCTKQHQHLYLCHLQQQPRRAYLFRLDLVLHGGASPLWWSTLTRLKSHHGNKPLGMSVRGCVMLSGVGRPTHYGWHYSLGRRFLTYVERGKSELSDETNRTHELFSLCSWLWTWGCLGVLIITMDCD